MSKKVMELALDALEKWDATIAYQHSGSNAGMSSRKDAMLTGCVAIAALKEAIKQQGKQQGEPNGYARYMVGMTPEGWSITICNPLYASAPSTNGECD
jgi:hypothetical protein